MPQSIGQDSLQIGGGSDLISIGSHGHINVESNLGAWPEGKRLLTKFKVSLGVEPQT